ncbi:MAG: hypothetical protein ACK4N5_23180 [Myxococcales bacterium]
MNKRLWAVAITGIFALLVICLAVPRAQADERVFVALQINEGEFVIAQPKLLGSVGTPLSMRLADERRPDRTRLELQLMPVRNGDEYEVNFRLTLPNRLEGASGSLSLLHGEEKKLALSDELKPVTMKLMLMRVDSPEFEAYMQLAKRRVSERTS